jgi:conjugal transfer mating pair stabilization protein TraG
MNTLTVYAYGNVDALHGIFNAIAMIMNSDDFAGMIQVALLIGFATVATLAVLPGNLSKSWNWFLTVTVLSSVLLVPKATVSIVDKLGQQPTVVVANVPWALGLMASVKSSVGATLTELFETAFQTIPSLDKALPVELSYQQNGMMFGSRLIRASREAEALSVYTKNDLIQYIRSCIFPEQGNQVNADQIDSSDQLSVTFSAMNNAALSASYHDATAGYVLVTAPCDIVWLKLQPALNAAGAEAVKKAASQISREQYKNNPNAATAALDAGLIAVYGKSALAAAASTSSQIMIQNILVNATSEAAALDAAASNDAASLMYASMKSQAVQQMNGGNMVQGRIAEEALPIVRNITEAILYAVFPVLCILLVASEGKALMSLFKSYVYVLLWVELWPPMFAIVNYLQTLEAVKAVQGAAFLPGGGTGLSLGTAAAIYSSSVSSLATSAWMVTFVPVIAAAVLFGMDRIMAITGATAGGLRAAQSEAAQATKGNLQGGNVSFDQQQLAAYRSDPAMYRTESVGGVEFRNVANGLTMGQYRSATAPVSLSDTVAVTRGMAAEASASMQSAQRHSLAYDRSIDAAYGTALTAAQGNAAAASKSVGFDVSKVGSNGVSAADIQSKAQRIAETHGISDVSTVSKAISAGLNGLPIPIIGAGGKTESGEALRKDLSAGVDALKSLGTQRKHDLVNQFRTGEAFEQTRRSNKDATQRVESSWREAQSHRESQAADLARSQQLSAKVEGAERFARESSANWANLLDQHARAKFGMSVHDGIADPRQWQKIVTSFIESGSIRTDTADGKLMWIPPDPGLGTNVVSTGLSARAEATARGGESGLQQTFDSANPGGGRAGVVTTHAANDAIVKKEQTRLGVTPTATVADGGLKKTAQEGQAEAGKQVAATGGRIARQQGESQLDYDKRVANLSSFHNPIGSDRNKALDGARFSDPAFAAEAQAEQVRREEELARLSRAEIPTDQPKGGAVPRNQK